MKKFFAMILALALAFSMSTVAFAARVDNGLGDESQTVTIKLDKNDGVEKYFVVISWGTLNFVYQEADNGAWNETSHSYTGTKTAGWVTGVDTVAEEVTSTITVENHSNAAVTFTYEFETENDQTIDSFNGVSASLVASKTSLASAAEAPYLNGVDTNEDGYADGDTATVTLTVGGTPTSGAWSEAPTTLDNIVITVSGT